VIEPGVFGPDDLDDLVEFARAQGFAILRGVYSEAELDALELECTGLQQAVARGELPEKCGEVVLVDDDRAGITPIVHYVCHSTEVSAQVDEACRKPALADAMQRLLGADSWMLTSERFGVVYQDARPGKESAYTRIGWHSDWQSGPQLDCWPSMAFTIHIDATSPFNGFLRVVPGSHLWATPAPLADVNGVPAPVAAGTVGGYTDTPPPYPMPAGFEKVPGEIAVYAERGDIIFHDAYLWHSAARATADETVRRHLRGGYYAGTPFPVGYGVGEFVKNAQR
jgi:ectoine hydroxylase-related dioxygenase (phytanoyl-CoA dioxygenase family)